MRHYIKVAVLLAGAGLAGCSATNSQPRDRSSSADGPRGPVGNGAFGEAVPAEYGQPASPRATAPAANMVQGHGFTGNGAFGEAP